MCAIFGIIGDCNKPLIKNMSKIQKHRGPDSSTFLINQINNFSIGMNRLAVIDKKKGIQPMFSWDKKIVCIFNGTIYNFKEIKNFLENHKVIFKTKSDTEVLVNSFSYWGDKCFNYFDGMWSAGFYNFKEKKFTLSRDYLGQKPLFYSLINKKKLIFSSEITGIFKYSKEFNICKKNLKLYHQFGYTPAPYTVYNEIFQVSPGEIINFKTKIIKSFFWDLKNGPDYNLFFKKNSKANLQKNFLSTLNNYLVADKLPALSLSSGLDSNIIRYNLKKLKVRLKMFTIGFLSKSFNEVENIIKDDSSLHYKKIMKKNNMYDVFSKIKKKITYANGDGSIIPTYFLFQQIRKKTNVTISGDGGDEIFFGYITFKAFWLAEKLKKIFPVKTLIFFKKIFLKLKVNNEYMNINKKLNLFFKYIDKDLSIINSYWLNNLKNDELSKLCGLKENHEEIKKIKKLHRNTKNNLRFCQLYYLKYYLPTVLDKVDNASMFNSVENRSPLLNKKLINFSLDTPVKENFSLFKNKKLLINLLGNNLPQETKKIKKHGFSFPKYIILKNKDLIMKNIDKNLLTNKKFFMNKYSQYLKNNNYENYIWNEVILNFTRQNLEK